MKFEVTTTRPYFILSVVFLNKLEGNRNSTTLAKKNRYSREIYEVDLEFDHVISCDIELWFDINATRGICATQACVADRIRCRMISHDSTADQSHEYLGCNIFFLARVVRIE